MKNELKNKVMLRIYIRYIRGVVINNAEYFTPVVIVTTLAFFVSIPDIISNTPKTGIMESSKYLASAAGGTEILVKSLLFIFTASISAMMLRLFQRRVLA